MFKMHFGGTSKGMLIRFTKLQNLLLNIGVGLQADDLSTDEIRLLRKNLGRCWRSKCYGKRNRSGT